MIKYKLICKDCKNIFDSWFSDSKEYEKLKKKKYLNCHICDSRKIEKTLMAPNILNGPELRNKDINMWLVRNGLAVSYKKYSLKYLHQEKMAQKEKIGLWQGKFDMPWEWRKKNK